MTRIGLGCYLSLLEPPWVAFALPLVRSQAWFGLGKAWLEPRWGSGIPPRRTSLT
jgi:hypothetical protein